MARVKSYKMTFRDSEICYNIVGYVKDLGNTVPVRFINEEQMELMNLMLHDITEPVFNCTEEEFYNRLTPSMLENYKELRSNIFKLETS